MAKTPTRNIMFKFLGDKKSLEKATRATTKSLGRVEKSAGGANKSLGILRKGAAALGGVLAVGALFKGMKSAVLRAQEMDSKYAITAKIIEDTGGAAGLTGDQIADMSKEMAMTTGLDKGIVLEAANILLTFKELKDVAGENNDVFSRAHKLTADLATVMGGTASSQAITLGKALQDPVRGLTALRRVGVTFTDKQVAVIKSMVETGDVLGAQKLLLDELESQVGGTAEASADATAIIRNAWQEVLELVGNELLPMLVEIAPVIVQMAEDAGPAIELLAKLVKEIIGPLGDLTSGFAAAGDTAKPAGERVSGLMKAVDALNGILDPVGRAQDEFNRKMDEARLAASDAKLAVFDMTGGLGDLEWQTVRTTGKVEDLVDETADLADEMRKLIDPVFRAKKAQEKFDETLVDVWEDSIVTRDELDKLTQANLDLAAANAAVTPENMEAYRDAVEETRESVVGDAKLMADALAGVGAEQSLEAFLGLVGRLEALSSTPITIDFTGLKVASQADMEQTVTRMFLSLQRRGILGKNVFL